MVQTDLFAESKDGVNKVLTGRLEGRELFEKMRPALINPVRRRTAICKEQLTDEFILAGDSAVAKQTMINDSTFRCYTVTGKKLTELPYAMSAETDVAVELWKYDPKLLSTNGMVDPLSLIMSFDDEKTNCSICTNMLPFWIHGSQIRCISSKAVIDIFLMLKISAIFRVVAML